MRYTKLLSQRPWTLLIVLLAVAMVAGWGTHQQLLDRMPSCLIYRATGMLCPGCGGRRCLAMLLQGRWLEAMQMNALLIALSVAFVGLLLRAAWREWSRDNTSYPLSSGMAWIIVACVVGFGILRNLPFPPFEWLTPPTRSVP